MSDPVTNADVEDVLSSIRRLVSEDKRPLQSSRLKQSGDRLVLTPALRVADAPAQEPDEHADAYGAESSDQTAGDAGHPTERHVSERAASALFDDDLTVDMGEDTPDAAQMPAHDDHADRDGTDRDEIAQDDTDADDMDPDDRDDDPMLADTGYFRHTPRGAVHSTADEDMFDFIHARRRGVEDDAHAPDQEGRHTEAEEPVAEPGAQALIDEPELSQVAAQACAEDHSFEDAPQATDAAADSTDIPERKSDADAAHSARNAAVLSAKIAALETAISKISHADDWEPDEPGDDAYAGTEAPSMAWEDDVELDARGAPVEGDAGLREELDEIEQSAFEKVSAAMNQRQQQVAPEKPAEPEEEAGGLAFGNDDQFLDEEALRDLVSEIVRSELQGALGERITRNVRKLVRREIHRALTAQELE